MNNQKKDIAEGFSKSSDFWQRIYTPDKDDIGKFYRLDMIDRKNAVFYLLEKYMRHGPYQILDVGCGPGVFLEEAAARGHLAVGIDLSESMVRKAGEMLHQRDLSAAFALHGDVEHLPFRDGTFDVVLCIGVTSYLPRDSDALFEIKRIVKEDGIVIMGLPNQLKLALFLDPYYYFHGIRSLKKRWDRDRTDERSSVSIENYRRYVFWRFGSLFGPFNLRILETIAVGFGPLTFWLKEVIRENWSLMIRHSLAKLAAHGVLPIKTFANHWVICLKKNAIRPRQS
jgi:SAM-dependent methyltransferase